MRDALMVGLVVLMILNLGSDGLDAILLMSLLRILKYLYNTSAELFCLRESSRVSINKIIIALWNSSESIEYINNLRIFICDLVYGALIHIK